MVKNLLYSTYQEIIDVACKTETKNIVWYSQFIHNLTVIPYLHKFFQFVLEHFLSLNGINHIFKIAFCI